jgi:hypothetical protein
MANVVDIPAGGDDVADDGNEKKPNPFDPRRLRYSQRRSEGPTARKIVSAVQVRKPNRQEYCRVHPDPAMRIETLVLDFKAEGMTYLVDPEIEPAIPGECSAKMLYLAVTRQGALLLWPVRLPDEQGNLDPYNTAAHQAALTAETKWVRIAANKGVGTYEVYEALDQLSEPEWPEITFDRVLEMAFKSRYIDTLEHPVVRRLLGEF